MNDTFSDSDWNYDGTTYSSDIELGFLKITGAWLGLLLIATIVVIVIMLIKQKKGNRGAMNRNIGLSVVLSIVTCSIYQIYWFAVLSDEISRERKTENGLPSGIVCLLLTLITCGIYGWYWAYKAGETIDAIKRERGDTVGTDNCVLYIILQVFAFNIIVLALMQNEMNKLHPLGSLSTPEQ